MDKDTAAPAQSAEPVEVTPAEYETAVATLRHVIECLRETGSYTDDEGEATDYLEPLLHASPQPSPTAVVLDDELNKRIREIFLANGFTIKEGQTDLKPYVYQAAYALLWATGVLTLPPIAQPGEPVAWLYYEEDEFIRMYDSEEKALAACEKFGGHWQAVYTKPVAQPVEQTQALTDGDSK